MDKEKKSKQSNKKNTKDKNKTSKKNIEEKVTNTKNTKATKKDEKKKEEVKVIKKKEKIQDEIEYNEDIEELDEEYDEDIEFDEDDLDEDFDDETDEEIETDEEDLDEDFDNEDSEFDEDEDSEEETIIEKKITEKKNKDDKKKVKKETNKKEEKNTKQENIKKIEKMAKEKKKKTKTSSSKLQKFLLTLDKNRNIIYSFVAGALLVTLVAFIIWPDRIATLKNGQQPVVKVGKNTYTADELYENMKDYYSVSLLLDDIDNDLLTKLYPENESMLEEVNSNAEYYYNMYEQYYNYTQEEFLKNNGFSSHEAFLDYLKLDYRRNTYLDDYVEDSLTDEEIQKYYDENVYGDINTQHILVEVKSDDTEDESKLSDEDAKKLAEEIITKLNDGTSWETIQTDYKDKITFEDLGYQAWDASLEESFMTALEEMEENSFSKEPVKTSYGYHVIYKKDQKKTPTLKKSKEKIVENLIADKKADDSNLLYKALISLREEKNIKFSDTVMEEKYKTYCEQYK